MGSGGVTERMADFDLDPQQRLVRAAVREFAEREIAPHVERYEREHTEFEASNLKRRGEAEAVAAKLEGLTCVLLRQASESAQLYGSVTARDIARAVAEGGATIHRAQVRLDRPIKTLGIHRVRIALHPEVIVGVDVNVARSAEEAQAQTAAAARGEAAPEAAASADEGKIGPARKKGEAAAEPAALSRDGPLPGLRGIREVRRGALESRPAKIGRLRKTVRGARCAVGT